MTGDFASGFKTPPILDHAEEKTYVLSWWEKNWADEKNKVVKEWRKCTKELKLSGKVYERELLEEHMYPKDYEAREHMKYSQVCLELGTCGLNTVPQTELELARAKSHNRRYFESMGGKDGGDG